MMVISIRCSVKSRQSLWGEAKRNTNVNYIKSCGSWLAIWLAAQKINKTSMMTTSLQLDFLKLSSREQEHCARKQIEYRTIACLLSQSEQRSLGTLSINQGLRILGFCFNLPEKSANTKPRSFSGVFAGHCQPLPKTL